MSAADGDGARFDRRVLLFVPRWDYGDEARGPSSDQHFFLPAVRATARETDVLWCDEALHRPGSLDQALLEQVDRTRPDLVLFFPARDDVAAATLRRLKEHTTTLGFFADDQWRFDGYSSRYATLFSYVATTDPAVIPCYRALGGRPLETQWAGRLVGPSLPPLSDDAAFRHDVSFVGGHSAYRGWLVGWLRRHGVDVTCFGAGWPRGRLSYAEVESTFRHSRINLNMSNSRQRDLRFALSGPRGLGSSIRSPKDAEQVKARHFEIPMAGGFQLSSYAVGLEDWLHIGREVMIYTSPEECLRQVTRLLADPERRLQMAARAWRRCLDEHTYERRVEALFRAVWPEDRSASTDR